MFSKAKNMVIGGHASFINHENNYNIGSGAESLDEGIRLLLPRVVTGAMHNSRHRFDAPSCHPETRIAIQEDLLSWSEQLVDSLDELVTWLYGPAGAGKSAIAQTIAQKLHARGQLTASFFFSRDSGGDGRGEESNFVATVAYQLSQTIPATQSHIAAAVRKNPLVFDLALRDQVDALIVAPLIAVSNTLSVSETPRVIVVDGLDECRKEYDAQKLVVDALTSGLHRIPHHNHKLFITSRPEDRIVAIFNHYEGKLVRRMELNNKWNPAEDIRTFLNAGFADIHRSHFYFHSHPQDKTWPNPKDVETLVRRSSGQFIYASVVLKYIKSDEYYNPVARLETILELKNGEDQPYAELDALYEYIFSQIRGSERVRVLTVLLLDRDYGGLVDYQGDWGESPFETFLSAFMGAHMDEIKFWLRPLVSLLVLKEGPEDSDGKIHYMHASLLDFLYDQSRSNGFCIHTPTIAAGIIRRAIGLLVDGTASKAISNFNVVDTVLCKIDADYIAAGHSALALTRYLNWVLAQSENENASHYRKPAAQIQTWLVNQFGHLDFNDLDHDDIEQIDVWPFFTCFQRTDASTEQISENLSAALEIIKSSLASCHLPVPMLNLSQQTAVLCCVMPDLAAQPESWLYRSDLLNRYAMTKERYGLALQRTACYVLQLPKHILLEVLNGANSGENVVETATFHLIRDVLHRFLVGSPPTTDLYFLMGLVYPVMRRLGLDPDQHILSYIWQVPKQLPFLNDPTSSDYIQTRARIEETCIDLNIKISFHELAEMVQKELVPYQHFV
ncbi:hypothetical protein D9619_000156 [Psilocybe cf. subviscida]|uniref:Nephrocystin 3-like N-terminal domain-containing protein n=1 Tax=Psilocybe cf. subviscida TaxID=2480587 RepID=A0A8H5BDD7_9AGAR|nr:hypothetical protein D9619_000156 [Psilocybe cf. subviscida]